MTELERKLKKNPPLSKVPVAEVHGRVVTAEELLELIKRGDPEAVRVVKLFLGCRSFKVFVGSGAPLWDLILDILTLGCYYIMTVKFINLTAWYY